MSSTSKIKIGSPFDAEITVVSDDGNPDVIYARTRDKLAVGVFGFCAFCIIASAGYSIWVGSFVPLSAVWGAATLSVGRILSYYFMKG